MYIDKVVIDVITYHCAIRSRTSRWVTDILYFYRIGEDELKTVDPATQT